MNVQAKQSLVIHGKICLGRKRYVMLKYKL